MGDPGLVTSPTSASHLTLSNVNVNNRQVNAIRPRMPVVSDENDSPRSSTETVNLVPSSSIPPSTSASEPSNSALNNPQADNRNLNMPIAPIYNPLPQTNFQMPLLDDRSRGESMLNIDESGETEGEEPDASTLNLMPKSRSDVNNETSTSSATTAGNGSNIGNINNNNNSNSIDASVSENDSGTRRNRNSIRNSIRNSLRVSIRDSRGPAPPYFEVVDSETETDLMGGHGRSGPPGLNVRSSDTSQNAGLGFPTQSHSNEDEIRPMSAMSTTTMSNASSSLHSPSNENGSSIENDNDDDSREAITNANTNANASANGRRRTGFRSFFTTLSRPPTITTNVSSSRAHARHRASQSGGSGSTFATTNSSIHNLSRTRSNNTLASNGSRLDVSSIANANASNTRLNSPSSLSVNSISAPLTHTVVRTEFRYPRGGPTPEQIRFISSKESLGGRFGVPYGADAIAHRAAQSGSNLLATLGGLDP